MKTFSVLIFLFTHLTYSQFQIFYTAPSNRGIKTIKTFQTFHENRSDFYVHIDGDQVTAQPPYWIRYVRETAQWNSQPHHSFLTGMVCYYGTGGFNWSWVEDFIKGRRDTLFMLGAWKWVTCIPPENGIESRITYNSGQNFTQPATSEGAMAAFDFDPLTDSIIYGVGAKFLLQEKLLKTTNKGINWSSVNVSNNYTYSIYSIKVNPLNRNVIYFSREGGFFRSNNAGSTVLNINSVHAHSIVVSPVDTTLLICNQNGIFRSTNGGYNFIQTLNVNTKILLIHTEIPTIIYAGTSQGLYRSLNSGINWDLYFSSFSGSQSVTGLAKYKNDLDTLYASNNRFVYKIWSSSIGIKHINEEIPSSYELFQNYPNPFNPITNIKFNLPVSGFTTLKIYDALGSELETLVNQNLNSGVYSVIWDGMNYPAGLYFYKLISGNYTDTKKMVLIK